MKEKEVLLSNRKLFLLLLGWSAVALLLLSPDSPIHGDWNRCDSAIFFTSGKALMNGLRPYVDFADSKGPLLWLLYGIGYLLSPRSYTGVYVVSCLWYAGIFYYNFKTARIFLKDDRRSMAVTMLMTFAYFLPWFHFEVRAEDYATLPVAISLYYLCRLLYGEEKGLAGGMAVTLSRTGIVLGACFMALVIIKYNIAAMQGIIILVVMWHLLREQHKALLPLIGWLSVGAVMVAVPFLVYLWMRGAVPAFIEEYFINTLKTVAVGDSSGNRPGGMVADLVAAWGSAPALAFLLFIVYGGWMLGRQQSHYRWVLLLVGVFFFALATRRNLGYYHVICHIFFIYLFIWSVGLAKHPYKTKYLAYIIGAVLGWGIYLNTGKGCQLQKTTIWADNEDRVMFERLADVLGGCERPRILNLYWNDNGYGIRQESLPAGRYWTRQQDSTPEMLEGHVTPIIEGKADVILVNDQWDAMRNGWFPGSIISYGYYLCFRDTCANGRVRAVYKKKVR